MAKIPAAGGEWDGWGDGGVLKGWGGVGKGLRGGGERGACCAASRK